MDWFVWIYIFWNNPKLDKKKSAARAGLKNVYFLHDFVQKTRLWRLRQRQEAAISCQRTRLDLAGK